MSAKKTPPRRPIRNVLAIRLKKFGSQRQICEAMGEGPCYLSGQDRNELGLREHDYVRLLATCKVRRPQEVFYEGTVELIVDPTEILEYAREHQKLEPDTFLEAMRPQLLRLESAKLKAGGVWQSREAEILALDRLRRRDRDRAKHRLQLLLISALDRLTRGILPVRGVFELCCIVLVLAALYRLAGRRDDAVDWLCLIWPLVRKTGNLLLYGLWYQKAAYLLVDLHYCARADDFILKAQDCFSLANANRERLRSLVDRAYVLTHWGHHQESKERLLRALPLLPHDDLEGRLSAHQTLGKNLQELGDLEGARKQLDAAIDLVGDDNLAHATCLWRRGRLLVTLGDIPAALASFAKALPMFAYLTSAGELAEMGMEYAGLLRQEKRRPEMLSLAADLAGWIEQLEGNLKLRDLIADFKALIEFNKLTTQKFEELLLALKATRTAPSASCTRKRSKPEARHQPPGG